MDEVLEAAFDGALPLPPSKMKQQQLQPTPSVQPQQEMQTSNHQSMHTVTVAGGTPVARSKM